MKFSALLATTLLFGSLGFAGTAVDQATQQLESTINSSVPADQRLSVLSKAVDLRQAIDDVDDSLRKLNRIVLSNVPAPARDEVLAKIADVKSALAGELAPNTPPPPPEPKSFVCAAACKSISGGTEASTMGIGKGSARLVALDKATQNVRSRFQCNYGMSEMGCEQESKNPTEFTCQVACKTPGGTPDMNYTALGQAGSEIEAVFNGTTELKKKYMCNYGIAKVTCEH